jgi:hypothetical protein
MKRLLKSILSAVPNNNRSGGKKIYFFMVSPVSARMRARAAAHLLSFLPGSFYAARAGMGPA